MSQRFPPRQIDSWISACAKSARVLATLLTLAGFALLTGCKDNPIVVHESVPVTRGSTTAAVAEDAEPKYRMVTAIAEQPTATWFFKLSGPIANVGAIQSQWGEFLGTVEFKTDVPTWGLPEGWKSDGIETRKLGGGITMQMGDVETTDSEVSISVSSLSAGQQLLPNVNRWRGQLGLGPTDATQLATDLSEIKTANTSFKVFDAQGPTLSTRMGGGRPPFASGAMGNRAGSNRGMMPSNHPPIAGNPQGGVNNSQTETVNETPIRFTAPEGWDAGKTSSMVVGRFNKQTEQGPIELMVMTMRATDEAWKMNVEAWAAQIKLEDKPDVDRVTENLKVAGYDAKKVHLDGPDPESKENPSVSVVLIKHSTDDGFVIKMAGSQPALKANQTTLDAFLTSISFVEPTDQE